MDAKTHGKYFARIQLNTNAAVGWPPWKLTEVSESAPSSAESATGAMDSAMDSTMWTKRLAVATKDRYDAMLLHEIAQGYHLQRIEELTPPQQSTTAADGSTTADFSSVRESAATSPKVLVIWLQLTAALLDHSDYKV
jgi:hypothetical protein